MLELVKRREAILKSINDQELLTPELEEKINNCWDMAELEDIYLPYKPKRKTRSSAAREKGLEPLAEIIMEQKEDQIELPPPRANSVTENAAICPMLSVPVRP